MGYKDAFEAADDFAANPKLRLDFQEFLNNFGHYHNAVVTDTVSMIHRTGMFPFARTQAATIPAELRQFVGGIQPAFRKATGGGIRDAALNEKILTRAEVLYRGTIGGAVTHALMNKTISGKWPWENEPGRWLDLNLGQIGEEGRDGYLRHMGRDPGGSRASRITGAEALATTLSEDEGVGTYVGEHLRALGNQAWSLVGPFGRKMYQQAFGKAPFHMRGGDEIPVGFPGRTPNRGQLNRLKANLADINPIVKKISALNTAVPEPAGMPLAGGAGTAQKAFEFAGIPMRSGRHPDQVRAMRGATFRQQTRDRATIKLVVREAMRTVPEAELRKQYPKGQESESPLWKLLEQAGFEGKDLETAYAQALFSYLKSVQRRTLRPAISEGLEQIQQGK
jgi:hypothetical protein